MSSTLEKLKKELEQQAETQEEAQEFDIEDIKIGQFTPELAALFKKYPNVQSIGFSGCGLTSLNNFPKFNNLENLILEENQLTGDALKFIAENFSDLVCLSLASNNIKTFKEVEVLKSLKVLHQLDLSDNPISQLEGYHKKLFELIPSLQVLDNKDEKGEEIPLSDEEDEDIGDEDDDDEEFGDEDDEDEDEEEEESKPKKQTKKGK